MFPLEKTEEQQRPPKTSSKESSLLAIQTDGVTYSDVSTPATAEPYISEADKSLADLSAEAATFYKLAATQSGLDVQTLIRAVDMVESQIQSVERLRNKEFTKTEVLP